MKIVVRLPSGLSATVSSFPFLHALKEEFPGVVVDLFSSKECFELFCLLPFKVNLLHLNSTIDRGVMGTHKFAYNCKDIFNVDLYFALEESFDANFMGFCFRSKYKIGHKSFMSKFLLDKSYEKNLNLLPRDNWVKFLADYTGKKYDKIKVQGQKVANHFARLHRKNYLVVQTNSPHKSSPLERKKWVELLTSFSEQKLIFVGDHSDSKEIDELIFNLEQKDDSNVKSNFAGKTNHLQLASLLAHAKGVILCDQDTINLATYIGAPVLALYNQSHKKIIKSMFDDTPFLAAYDSSVESIVRDSLNLHDIDTAVQEIERFFCIGTA